MNFNPYDGQQISRGDLQRISIVCTDLEELPETFNSFTESVESWIIVSSEVRHDQQTLILVFRVLQNLEYWHAMISWIAFLWFGCEKLAYCDLEGVNRFVEPLQHYEPAV
jgi:hypothetical protein